MNNDNTIHLNNKKEEMMNTKYLLIASMLVVAGIENSIFATITLKNRTGDKIWLDTTTTDRKHIVNLKGETFREAPDPMSDPDAEDKWFRDLNVFGKRTVADNNTDQIYNVTFDILVNGSKEFITNGQAWGQGRQISVDGVRTPDWSGLLKNGSTYVITKQNAAPDIYVFTTQK